MAASIVVVQERMDPIASSATIPPPMSQTSPESKACRPGFGAYFFQLVLGALCYLFFVVPYVRRIRGLGRITREHRLYVSNHVSLLDTIAIGGLFWSRARLPILVLGDREVWHKTPVHRFLSAYVGYLIDRGKTARGLIEGLRSYGQSHAGFNLFVFPEGTRGDGATVGPCQPGVQTVAQAADIPIVPLFIAHMQDVSSKHTRFRPLAGLRRVELIFGDEIAPERYRGLDREAFGQLIQSEIQALAPSS